MKPKWTEGQDMSEVEKVPSTTSPQALWKLKLAKALVLVSLPICFACLITGNGNGFLFGFLGLVSALVLGGTAKDRLSNSTNRKKVLYREIEIADGLRLELYKSAEGWLAPKLFKNIGKYGKYIWYDSCRKWQIGLSPGEWNDVVKCISENNRRKVWRETYNTHGDWVFIYDDWTFAIRRVDWDVLVRILNEEGVFDKMDFEKRPEADIETSTSNGN